MPQGKLKTKTQVPVLKGKSRQTLASVKKQNQQKRGGKFGSNLLTCHFLQSELFKNVLVNYEVSPDHN